MFQQVDGDTSGEIDLAEFQRLYQKVGINLSGKELQDQFRMYDSDNSGTISLAELQSHVQVTKGSHGYNPDLHLRAVFTRFDENRDGHLDARELANLFSTTGIPMTVQEAENQIRVNGFNGRVTFEDLRRICNITTNTGYTNVSNVAYNQGTTYGRAPVNRYY